MLQLILIFFGGGIAAVLLYAATLPNTFHYESRVLINAPAEKIFPWLVDVKKNTEWSPWQKQDPTMKHTYSTQTTGVGASDEWDGNRNVGAGKATITEIVPNQKVVMKLDFYRPMQGTNTAEYVLTPKDGGTEMAWIFYGKQPYLGKVMSLVFNCEKMMKKIFAEGLANLKLKVE